MSSIAVAAGSTLNLGGSVTFDCVIDEQDAHKAHGEQFIYVQILAIREDGAVVWATAGKTSSTFVLGPHGHWNDFDPNVPGSGTEAVTGHADLYYFKGNSGQEIIASVEFPIAGA